MSANQTYTSSMVKWASAAKVTVELSISFLKVRSLLRFWERLLWLRARAFQNDSWKVGWGPGENGKGKLNPFCVFIWGELFVDLGIKCDVVDMVLECKLFIPFGVIRVRWNIILEKCVVFEKNACGFGVRAEGGSEGRVAEFECVNCLFGNHFVSCSS